MNPLILATGETSGMAGLLTDIGSVFTQAITWVGNVGTTIVSTPVLLLGTAMVVIGFAVGLFKRML